MSVPKARPRKTLEDYMALDGEERVELIRGDFFVTPSPTHRHQRIVFNLAFALRTFVEKNGLGEICLAPLDVILPSGDVVQPDVLFIATRSACIVEERIRGVPELVIEVVSQAAPERDRIVKRDLYAANGVGEYWIVDDETKSIEVLVHEGGSYREHGYFVSGDTLASAAFPALELTVAAIFA